MSSASPIPSRGRSPSPTPAPALAPGLASPSLHPQQALHGGRLPLSARSSTDSLRPPAPPYGYPSPWNGMMDPRSSSTQSLAPSIGSDADGEQRRRLLIVYLHGFYGNDQSFRSFPAHVHAYLKEALADSHVVHSKIYPKYKTYKAIELARDNFSQWLQPHENDMTDLIIVGHSMGGILAADIVLMPNQNPYSFYPYKHRILGTISLDAPLLGLHPGIIVAGISSIFKSPASPEPASPEPSVPQSHSTPSLMATTTHPSLQSYPSATSASSVSDLTLTPMTSISTSSLPPQQQPAPDPTFNPPFFNDVLFKDRPFMRRIAHFAQKHRQAGENLVDAATNHILSHLEFGGVLADYPGMHARYNKIRALEDVDDLAQQNSPFMGNRPKQVRVRFVNYYTISTGRVKKPKDPGGKTSPGGTSPYSAPADHRVPRSNPSSGVATPRISIEDHSDGERQEVQKLLAGAVDAKLNLHANDTEDALPVPPPYDEGDLSAGSLTDLDPIPEDEEPQNPPQPKKETEKESETESATISSPVLPSDVMAPPPPTSLPPPPPLPLANPSSSAPDIDLPPIPPVPEKPTPPNLELYPDKHQRRQIEKEAKRTQKAYDQAVKDREKAIRERQKLIEKREKKARQEAARQSKEEQKRKLREGWAEEQKAEAAKARSDSMKVMAREEEKIRMKEKENKRETDDSAEKGKGKKTEVEGAMGESSRLSADLDSAELQPTLSSLGTSTVMAVPKPQKERKFCTLPRKVEGARDPTWVRVFMDGFDEVGAHCGLFLPGPHYERLVGDVGQRIVRWVQDDLTRQTILGLETPAT